jgi:hypothetical protein
MPTLRDIFDLPEQVYQGDFVLKLTAGLENSGGDRARLRRDTTTCALF